MLSCVTPIFSGGVCIAFHDATCRRNLEVLSFSVDWVFVAHEQSSGERERGRNKYGKKGTELTLHDTRDILPGLWHALVWCKDMGIIADTLCNKGKCLGGRFNLVYGHRGRCRRLVVPHPRLPPSELHKFFYLLFFAEWDSKRKRERERARERYLH